jgi:predicted phosphodiesterase
MARYGILGDIHGNREALEAALAALEERGVRRFLCVGDIVGYNADPDACVELVRARHCTAISGNHDLIGTGRLGFRRCSNKAMYSLKRTRRTLSAQSAAWLRALPARSLVEGAILLVHGGVRDVEQYMVGTGQIRENAAYLREDAPQARICFFGHSHEQKAYEVDAEQVVELRPFHERIQLKKDGLYFVNPGSVDAARKRSGRLAECAIFDTEAWSIEFIRVRYDAASSEIKAGMGGYRIGPWTDLAYSLIRRVCAVSLRAYRTFQAPATYRAAEKR